MILENGLPVGVYVCRVVALKDLGFYRCGLEPDGEPVLHGRLQLAIAHGVHSGRVATVVSRQFGSHLPESVLEELDAGNIDYAKILAAIGPKFVQIVRVEVPVGRCIPRCVPVPGATTFVNSRTRVKIPPNKLDALARAALGADPLLSFEETLARYRALAADELAAVFGSTAAGRARR